MNMPTNRVSWILIAIAALVVSVQPVFAEDAWDNLDHGVNVVRECAGDIKACMAGHLADLSRGCIKALAEPEPAVLSDGDHAVSKRIENSHLMRFIEM
jgi:hypothetical protein